MGVLGTVRASFALYNTREEVDALCQAVRRVAKMFK
jgi:cysteine desulfurase/selenocysteine lyase